MTEEKQFKADNYFNIIADEDDDGEDYETTAARRN